MDNRRREIGAGNRSNPLDPRLRYRAVGSEAGYRKQTSNVYRYPIYFYGARSAGSVRSERKMRVRQGGKSNWAVVAMRSGAIAIS